MPSDAAYPDFPADLEQLAPPGVVASYTAIELGVFYRLARYAWRSEPPCTLPDDVTRLAAIVGVSPEQFAELMPRILLAVEPFHGGRWLLPAAEKIHRSISARQARRSAAGATAARSRWEAGRMPDDPGPPGGPSESDAKRMRIASDSHRPLQSSRSSALPLHRSNPSDQIQSAQTDVIGVLSEGARAAAQERLGRWRRERCREMIEKALSAWIAAGYADRGFGPKKITELVEGPHTTPARVEFLIGEGNWLIELDKAGKSRQKPRPLGKLIYGLGLARESRGPAEVPTVVTLRWQKAEEQTLHTSEALAAVQARLNIRWIQGAEVARARWCRPRGEEVMPTLTTGD